MLFSLILPTIGRKSELLNFINSLILSAEEINNNVELIIIDQNKKSYDLEREIKKINCNFDIVYIHSDKKGLSYNRNVGLRVSKGKYIAFPDDDCLYYPETLKQALDMFLKKPKLDFVLGQIIDNKTGMKIIKNWPDSPCIINQFNYYFLSSSITIFSKFKEGDLFDENLGVGAQYGSCEDPDYIYSYLKNKRLGLYTPNLSVWHPVPDMKSIPLQKVNSYASGFGFFIRKNLSIFNVLLLCLLLGKKTFQFCFQRKSFAKGYFYSYLSGIYSGLTKSRVSK
jgi:glycosyltransferase involved in cell wall biosynthesis